MIDEIKRALSCDDASALEALNRAAGVERVVTETLGAKDPSKVREAIAALAAKAAKADALVAELSALKIEVEKDRHEATLAAAVKAGKIPPAEAEYWRAQSLASLTAYVGVATTKVATQKLDVNDPALGEAVDPRLLAQAGLSQDEYLAKQASYLKRGLI